MKVSYIMSEILKKIVELYEALIKLVLENPNKELLKVYLIKDNNDAILQAIPNKIESMLKSLFISRSNSYGMSEIVNLLNKSFFNKIPDTLTIKIFYFDKFSVKSLIVDSPEYKQQVDFWELIDSAKPSELMYSVEREIKQKTRVASDKEEEILDVDLSTLELLK